MARRLPAYGCALLLALCLAPAALADSGAPGASGGTSAGSAGSSGGSSGGGGTAYGVGTEAERRRTRERVARRRARERRQRRQQGGVFPVRGAWSYGDRFGVGRDGGTRQHMGQDIPAAEGTPLVAVRSGTITTTGYQAGGAGYYLVLKDARIDFSYVYMHLRAGSRTVSEGERVSSGERVGAVGSTGDATGPHLHFEVWRGRWLDGGQAVDPLPYLKRWER
jgi:murein DD-endopeptidase MepM/ murein hydrolase activator NlpD